MGQNSDQPNGACPFRECGEKATEWITDLWILDKVSGGAMTEAGIPACQTHAHRFQMWLAVQRERPAAMEYRSAAEPGEEFTPWTRLPEQLFFGAGVRPRVIEFRRRTEPAAPSSPIEPPAPGPSSVQPFVAVPDQLTAETANRVRHLHCGRGADDMCAVCKVPHPCPMYAHADALIAKRFDGNPPPGPHPHSWT